MIVGSVLLISVLITSACANNEMQDAQAVNSIEAMHASIEAMEYEKILREIDATNLEEKSQEEKKEWYRIQGIAQIGIGDFEQAALSFEEAIGISAGFMEAVDYDLNQYLALAYTKVGRIEEAQRIYETLLELNSKDAPLHYLNGIALLQLERSKEGVEAFRRAIELEPNQYDRIIEIYQILVDFEQQEVGQEIIMDTIDSNPRMSDFDLGRMYYYVQDYELAIDHLEMIVNPETSDVVLYLGKCYEALGDINYVASIYAEAVNEFQDATLYNQLGLCQLKRESYDAALDAFQKGLDCEDEMMMQILRYHEIIAYEFLGDFDTARQLMENYLLDYPDDEKAKREYEFLKTR